MATAVIIGLGRIGMGYDLDAPDVVLTHARAFAEHPSFERLVGVDPDPSRRAIFEARYGEASGRLADVAVDAPDVAVVAAPTTLHEPVAREALGHLRPRLLLMEKPLAHSMEGARAILEAADAAGALVAVNYVRRFEPGAGEVHARLRRGDFGTVDSARLVYSAGLVNGGSHLLDLLGDWLGEPTAPRLLHRGRDLAGGDCEPDFGFSIGTCRGVATAARDEAFALAEIELVTTAGVLRYQRGGGHIEWVPAEEDLRYPGERGLAAKSEVIPSDLDHYQRHVVDAVVRALAGDPDALPSTGRTALGSLRFALEVVALRGAATEERARG